MSLGFPPQHPALTALAGNSQNNSTSTFSPRREFIRDRHQISNFALLALSASSAVRLYSFPQTIVEALRFYFQQNKILSNYREDTGNGLCEFLLDGRPWAISKSIKTEKLIVDIIALILRHGFVFLSTIDYGREQDDRIALAFSRPRIDLRTSESSPPLSGGTPVPQPQQGSSSGSPPLPTARPFRVPFAISFSSSTVLRVINPPLNSTPAILQAVRGAWPRGVIAEKKIADTCFEFKLKGYKCTSFHFYFG
jgi:hypothetical protein